MDLLDIVSNILDIFFRNLPVAALKAAQKTVLKIALNTAAMKHAITLVAASKQQTLSE
ncbi:MAG: hypothetical protein LBG58_01575 [Planctomycetaceae bacterium]|nr:hypothetical protein [Planctomycetaceae bacterium]